MQHPCLPSPYLYTPIQIRVWSRSDTEHQTDYALKCAVNLMNYYEEKFGIEFPLPKQGESFGDIEGEKVEEELKKFNEN